MTTAWRAARPGGYLDKGGPFRANHTPCLPIHRQ